MVDIEYNYRGTCSLTKARLQHNRRIMRLFNAMYQRHKNTLGVLWKIDQPPMWRPKAFHSYDRKQHTWGPYDTFEWYFSCFGRIGAARCRYDGRTRGAKGNGAIALREICDLADRFGIVIALHAQNEGLTPYYQQFGFILPEFVPRENLYFTRAPRKIAELEMAA